MKFCAECGNQLSESARFCNECGTPVKAETITDAGEAGLENAGSTRDGKDPHHETHPGENGLTETAAASVTASYEPANDLQVTMDKGPARLSPPRKRMSRGRKIGIIFGIILLAAAAGGFFAGKYYYSAERLIEGFEQALEDKDGKALASLLTPENDKLVINEQTVSGFIKYMEKVPEEKDYILHHLKEQAEESGSYKEYINLEKTGKVLFFDQYSLIAAGDNISVETNYAGTVILVNGEQVATADTPDYKGEVGPYLPGLYTMEARFKNDYVDLKAQEELTLMRPGINYTSYLWLDGEEVMWDTGFSDDADLEGRLYINGKEVEGVQPFETDEYGPVTSDGSLKLSVEADFPWGTVKSSEAPIDELYTIDIDFTSTESMQTMIEEAVVHHSKENLAAFASGDTDKLTMATDEYKEALLELVDQFKSSGFSYQSRYLGVVIDRGSVQLEFEDGAWYISVIVQPLIEAAVYRDGETPEMTMDEAYSRIIMRYDEEAAGWKVVSTGDYWSFQTEELKEIKESNPPMFKSTWNLKVDKASAEGTPEYTLPQVQQFMDQYVRSYIKATGSQDINLVSGLIDPDGPVYEQTAEYFKELDDISLTASDLLIEVQDFQALSESTYQVTTKETYDVQYSDGSVIQGTFIAVYSLVSKDGELKVRELLGSEEQ